MTATGPAPITIVPAGPAPAGLLAALHRLCFCGQPWHRAWRRPEMATVLALPSTRSWLALSPSSAPVGLLLIQIIAPEAEILTLGVRPGPWRRRGVADRLLAHAGAALADAGVTDLFLEVAAANTGALAFYRQAGFVEVGRRAGYYGTDGPSPVDAVVMRCHPIGQADPPETRSGLTSIPTTAKNRRPCE